MMTSKMLKFPDSWKTQKSKYLENKTELSPLIKKFMNSTLRAKL